MRKASMGKAKMRADGAQRTVRGNPGRSDTAGSALASPGGWGWWRRAPGRPPLAALLVWLVPWIALAAFTPRAEAQEPGAAEDVETSAPEQRFGSPREALRVFLESMSAYDTNGRPSDLERAMLAAGLAPEGASDPDNQRSVRRFYSALNNVEYVDLESLPGPGDPRLLDEGYHHEFGPAPGRDDLTMRVVFVDTPEAGWTMTIDSMRLAATEEILDLPPVGDLPASQRLRHALHQSMPDALRGRAFVLENWQWFGLALLVFLAVIVDRITRGIAARIVGRLIKSERASIDAEVLANFERPVGLFMAAWVFGFGLPFLGLDSSVGRPLSLAAEFVFAVAIVWAAYRLVDVFCGYLASKAAQSENKFDDVFVPLLRRTLKIFVIIVGLVYLASRWTADLWSIVAGLGIGSIAVGFAARDSIENLFGTFTVLLDKPFQLGDWVIAGDLEGSVEEVGFRSTRIRTFYNSLITVPNRTFISSAVDNMGERRYRRIRTTLGLTYDTPPEKIEAFCEGVRQILRSHPYSRKDYYHVYLNGFGASSLEVLLYCFLETPDWSTELREKHRLFADILRLAEQLKVGFAFPSQTLYMAKPEDLEHPDRPSTDVEGAQLGVRVADAVLAKSMADFGGVGHRPAPVEIEKGPRHMADDGEDGGG